MDTHALTLFAHVEIDGRQCDACLLVYADPIIQDASISTDVRDIYAARPSTTHIYVLAPFSPTNDTINALLDGTALTRAKLFMEDGGAFHVLDICASETNLEVMSERLVWEGDTKHRKPQERMDPALIHGWLFDLFDQGNGLVSAPIGVHFRKGSGKHANQFLRTANALLSSHACATLAFFALTNYVSRQPRLILVDTAPLISIAQAMIYIANRRNLWTDYVAIKSFSSYGGLNSIPRIARNDWILVSASTSGSLADELEQRGANRNNISILYYLASSSSTVPPQGVVCDLTHTEKRSFGYRQIANYRADDCPLCSQGFILAELEGDQFLFQKRQSRRVRVKVTSQSSSARKLVEKLTRSKIFQTNFRPVETGPSLIHVNVEKLIQDKQTRSDLVRHLKRYVPTPLKYVVLSDIPEEIARTLLQEAQVPFSDDHVEFVDWTKLKAMSIAEGAGALVLFGLLIDHGRARQINATLRSTLPKGNVAYVSALTVSESPEQHASLSIFLTYGEHGRDTFVFRSANELAFPINAQGNSAWEQEYDLLSRVCTGPSVPSRLQGRKQFIENRTCSDSNLFLTREGDDLSIKNDFVYLSTSDNVSAISQSDILVVVGNVLASARCHDRTIGPVRNPTIEPEMRSSLYGHVLLCPENFRNYNDAILRAAFLRLATTAEMAYAADEACSEEMLEIIEDEILAWEQSSGSALPEFILALACGRLQLDDRHMAQLQTSLKKIEFPDYIQTLIAQIPTH
jgi:hypothetical protein